MTRAPVVAPALDPTHAGRDVLSALAAAWSSSHGAAAASVAVTPTSALPARFGNVRRMPAVPDRIGAANSRRRVAGR